MQVQWKKTEFLASIAGILATLATAVVDSGLIVEGTKIYAIISIAAMVAAYVAGRSWVKASAPKQPPPKPSDAASIQIKAPDALE